MHPPIILLFARAVGEKQSHYTGIKASEETDKEPYDSKHVDNKKKINLRDATKQQMFARNFYYGLIKTHPSTSSYRYRAHRYCYPEYTLSDLPLSRIPPS
jgi:hypothetical protein